MEEEEASCMICMEIYDESDHTPRTLRCGHTFCTPCIDTLLRKVPRDRNCPECRKYLKISKAEHLPISYTILRLSRALSSVSVQSACGAQALDGNICLVHGFPLTSCCIKCNKWFCHKCHSHKGEPNCECVTVNSAILKIKQKYVDHIETKVENLAILKDSLTAQKCKVEQEIQKFIKRRDGLQKSIEMVDEFCEQLASDEADVVEANSIVRLDKASKQVDKRITHVDEWSTNAQASPVESSVDFSLKPDSPKSPLPASQLQPPIPAENLISRYPASCLTLEELKLKLKINQSLYAVMEKEDGSKRYGKLSIDGSRLLLHKLDHSIPPSDALSVQFDTLNEASDMGDQEAFFEVVCNDVYQGRIYMSMFKKSRKTLQFMELCSGKNGPSFKSSKLRRIDAYNEEDIPCGGGIECLSNDSGVHQDESGHLSNGISVNRFVENCVRWCWFGDQPYLVGVYSVKNKNDAGDFKAYIVGSYNSGIGLLRSVFTDIQCSQDAYVRDCGIAFDMKKM